MKKFSPEDREVFQKAYGSLSLPLAEQNFKWLLLNSMTSFYNDVEWDIINKNLCLFVTFEGVRYVWGPPLPGEKLQETLEKCFSLCEEYNKAHSITAKPELLYLPDEYVPQYSKLSGFLVKHQNQDYIYNSKELVKLEGGIHKKKRNLINSLLKSNEVTSETYSAEKHEKACLNLLERWKSQKEELVPDDYEEKFRQEADMAEKTLKLTPNLSLTGLVVFVNGNLEGFTLGDRINENMCSIFVEKTNLSIKGLPPFIFTEFVKKCWSSCELINAGEDWDVEYLKVSKMSYRPAIIHRFHTLFRK
ncbi:DUF2156 domain-containing protein [Candidatus Woesearchaeota archaeon]|nr:DUF2156 domain-containing protein [Candidatus Woesearchaeota archaeon]